MSVRRYELTDSQWDRIKDQIPHAKTGRPPKDDRMMLNAMFWLPRSGAFRLSLARTGPCTAASASGAMTGTLLRIFQELNADAGFENLCIDSTSINAYPQRAGKKGLQIRKTISLSGIAGMEIPQKSILL